MPFHQLLIANIMSANFIFIGKSFARIVLFFFAMKANNSSYALFFFDPDFSFIESIVTANWFNLIIKSVRSWSSLCSHGTKICGPNSLILILSLSFPSRFSLFILLCFFVPFSFFVHIFWFFFCCCCHSFALSQCDTLCSLFCYFSSSLSVWLRSRDSFWIRGTKRIRLNFVTDLTMSAE